MNAALGNADSLRFFLPETVLTAGAVATFLIDVLLKGRSSRHAAVLTVSLLTLAAAAALTFLSATWPVEGFTAMARPLGLFASAGGNDKGLIVLDGWSLFFKYVALAVTAAGIAMAAPDGQITKERFGEYCALLLSIAVGLCLMASASDLLMIAIAIELVSLVSYALAGFRRRDKASAEAALKYVVYGGVASGIMLFGMSWLYGLFGTTQLSLMAPPFFRDGAPAGYVVTLFCSLVMVLAGVGYKIAAVPWHMWCPDVYEGAPTPFTAFLSVGPKAAGFALAVRLFHGTFSFDRGLDAAFVMPELPWPTLIGVLALVTMTVGNLAALGQENVKRMLAYSSIAHAGYLLMGLAAASVTGSTAIALYLVLYLFMNLGAFLVVATVAQAEGGETLRAFRGLSSRAPFLAVAFAIFLFSLTGLPPLAGFVGKFHLFKAVMDRGGAFNVTLAVFGVLNSALSLYYYARIVRTMFLDPSEDVRKVPVALTHRVLLFSFVAATVGLGIFFEPLRHAAARTFPLFGHG